MGNLKYFFKSLISNKAAVEGYKRPWYLAFIFFLLSLTLVWIPPYVSYSKTRGSSSIINSSGMDAALTTLILDDSIGFSTSTIDNDKYFIASDEFKTHNTDTGTPAIITKKTNDKTINVLHVYYFDGLVSTKEGNEKYTAFVNNLFKKDDQTIAPYSFMIVSKEKIDIVAYPLDNQEKEAQAIASFTGLYTAFDSNKTLKEIILKDVDLGTNNENLPLQEITNSWCSYLDLAYDPIAFSQMLTLLIVALCSVPGLLLVGGLIIFIVSKGKRSIYRDMNYFEGMKVVSPYVFTGSVFSLLGLLLQPTIGLACLVGVTVIRIVFTMNKINIKPVEEKPFYQART